MGGNRCVAPNCTSGYDGSKEKVYKFSVSKDKERLKLWEQAIKRGNFELKLGQVVRSKHFLPDDISWAVERKDTTGNIMLAKIKTSISWPCDRHYWKVMTKIYKLSIS